MNADKTTKSFSMDFMLAEWNRLKIPTERISDILKEQLLMLINDRSTDYMPVIDEILALEGLKETKTKKEDTFKGTILNGYWKKHYYSSRFIPQNFINHWQLDISSEKFSKLAFKVCKQYEQNGYLPGGDRPTEAWKMSSDLVAKLMKGLSGRKRSKKLTGEWIVFKKHSGLNYYLLLAGHNNNDELIKQNISLCENEFPFLFLK